LPDAVLSSLSWKPVPFRDYSSFNEATLKVMAAAYDAAMIKLGIKAGDPRTSSIAARIAALASEGERDPDVLCEQAITGLAK
jgi:hypothetical protein